MAKDKVVLAYSGGLDTTALIPWLKETYGYEILTEIQKQGGEIFAFAEEGTIYPILYRLTKAGLIQYRLVPAKAKGGEKKYYSLTGSV